MVIKMCLFGRRVRNSSYYSFYCLILFNDTFSKPSKKYLPPKYCKQHVVSNLALEMKQKNKLNFVSTFYDSDLPEFESRVGQIFLQWENFDSLMSNSSLKLVSWSTKSRTVYHKTRAGSDKTINTTIRRKRLERSVRSSSNLDWYKFTLESNWFQRHRQYSVAKFHSLETSIFMPKVELQGKKNYDFQFISNRNQNTIWITLAKYRPVTTTKF